MAGHLNSKLMHANRISWAKRIVRIFVMLAVIVLIASLALYVVLVTPRRTIQCLHGPIAFINRFYGDEAMASLPGYTDGNRVTLYVNGNEVLPAILNAIDNADESIRWEVMLFYPDQIGQEIAEALAEAAQRGVHVQILFDQKMSTQGTIIAPYPADVREEYQQNMSDMLDLLREAGVAVLDSQPTDEFPSNESPDDVYQTQMGIARSSCVRWNHYDHRKILVIDNELVFIGGMNVGKEYLYHIAPDISLDMVEEANQRMKQELDEAWPKWLDAVVSIDGPAVLALAHSFNIRWQVARGTPLPVPDSVEQAGESAVRVVFQQPGLPEISTAYLELVNNANDSIFIASPYVNYDVVLDALISARRRGVRVLLISSSTHNDVPSAVRALRIRSPQLLEAGIEYYENELRMVHTKIMMVDDRWLSIGSFNLNHRSFNHDLEANVLIDDPSLASQVMERIFAPYISSATRITVPYDIPSNLLDWFVEPFS